MTDLLARWLHKYFSDPEALILAIILVVGFTVVIYMGDMLAPVLASLVIAYLLEALVRILENHGVGRTGAVLVVFVPFLALLFLVLFGLLPLLSSEVSDLIQDLPNMITRGQKALLQLPERYPNFISQTHVQELMSQMRHGAGAFGQYVLSLSLASISGLFVLIVYLILLPVLVFLFLKDKHKILGWLRGYLPRERALATRVWREMDQQIGNYVRGKFAEIAIVGTVSYAVFALLKLNYAMLLGALVGLSVIIPYIGAIVVTFPVAMIAYFQWGVGADFAYLLLAYGIIQAVDGNLLVPWLFSEAVNLHPIAIIVAVLVFGGIWGFWGVFFAIPLATLVKAVMVAWPRADTAGIAGEPPGANVGDTGEARATE